MAIDLILGTAGHIDHGKTSLVRALTGIDTDRLPEEKRRGITIDLGFAHLDLGAYRLGIVDVPGHERFVRNMLAGATSMDLALLVVAADDSVKPQTQEHFDILRLLGLEAGVIALTKCDLVEPAWLTLVEEEIRQLVAGTFLAEAPLVRTSVKTGAGLEALRGALAQAAEHVVRGSRARQSAGPFRLAIDRTFSVAGHGTVVTGSVARGVLRVGDELEIQPGARAVRVRGIESHGKAAEEVHRGQRAAVNLVGVHHQEIARGQELATPRHLVPSKVLTVELQVLPSAPRAIKNRSRVHCHIGTAECMASVRWIDADQVAPGAAALAQLFLARPVVATWNQGFIVRHESPLFTLGGGRVLDPQALPLRKGQSQARARIAQLTDERPVVRAAAATYLLGLRSWEPNDLVRLAGVEDPTTIVQQLSEDGQLESLVVSPTRTVRVHRDALADLFARVEAMLARLHAAAPLEPYVETATLLHRLDYFGDPMLVTSALAKLQQSGTLRVQGALVALASHAPQLNLADRKLLTQILATYEQAAWQPPSLEELQARFATAGARVAALVRLATSEGQLCSISGEFLLHATAERRLRSVLAERLARGPGLPISEIRNLLSVTRKHAVPLCEYLDRIGFTRRVGDLRVLADDTATAS